MEQIFISVLNRSLTAAYCVVVVLCIRMCIWRNLWFRDYYS